MDEVTKQLRKLKEEDPRAFKELLLSLDDKELSYILSDWNLWARENQLPPDGSWRIWLVLAGRGLVY